MQQYIKLSEYAKKNSVTYRTAWTWYSQGKIKDTITTPGGTILVRDTDLLEDSSYGVILYARTSSSSNKELLERQAERLQQYAVSKGYKIKAVMKEFGSGLNDERPKLSKILQENLFRKINKLNNIK